MEYKINKYEIKLVLTVFLFGIILLNGVNVVGARSNFVNLGEYDIEYAYNEDDIIAGERFTLTVTITNEDNENKENVRFKFDEEYPFKLVGDDDWNIEELNIGESATKNFRVEIDEDADSDDYKMKFKIKDNKEDYKDEFKIEVKSDKAEFIIGNLQSDPTTILPDMKDIKLTVEIQNTGDVDAKYVKAKLELPPGFSPSNSYSDIANLGTIKAGGTKEAFFYIDTEKILKPDLYNAKIHLDYKKGVDKKTKDLEIDLPVYGIPQFLINDIKTEPTEVAQGDSVVLKIRLKNIGEKEGKDTSIKVFEKSDQPFEFEEKTNYIGTLKPKETGTAILKFNVDKDAIPTNYLLDIQIRTVYDENVLISDETIPIKVHESKKITEDFLKIGSLIITGILIILISLLIYKNRKIKKFKRI